MEVTHPRLHRAFLRGVRWSDPENTFIVQLGRFRGWLDVEDTAFWVTAYDPETGRVDLSDGTSEPLEAETLRIDADEALRCTAKGRFPARFTRAAQAHLLDATEPASDGVRIRAGGQRLHADPYRAPA